MNKSNGQTTVHTYRDGTPVRILSSRHHDVCAGDEGVVDGFTEGGYFIKIDGWFLKAGDDRGKRVHEIQSLWYPPEEFEVLIEKVGVKS